MPTNIEIKARAREPERQRALALALADGPPTLLSQIDTFFTVPAGRLKLRQVSSQGGPLVGQLIRYDRPDQAGPKQSDYVITEVADVDACLREQVQRHGLRGEVRKRRELIMIGQTRVHLDEVAGLGSFLELEVVLRPDQSAEAGHAIAERIRRALDIHDEDLIEQAYIDLLEARGAAPGSK